MNVAVKPIEPPEFTQDDFLSDSAYRWLMEHATDPFTEQRLLAKLSLMGVKYGVRNVKHLYNQYKKEKRRKETGFYGNATNFDGQPIELYCGDYVCGEEGIEIYARDANVVVCRHPIMPIKRLVDIDTGDVKTEIAYKLGKRWRTEMVEKQVLANAQKILTLADKGVAVDSTNARDIVAYMSFLESQNYDDIPEIMTVQHLGWVDGDQFSPYLDGLIYDCQSGFQNEYKAVRSRGSFETWLELAKEVRAGTSLPARIALAASFASPLLSRLDALPFMVHLWGSISGIGKSVALLLAGSVWADPEIGNYVKPIRGTNAGLENYAAFCRHLPVCLDELQTIQGRKDFDELIYVLCEGTSKLKSTKEGGVGKILRWNNAFITTGEMPITNASSKAGAVNRVIEVECTEGLFADPRAASQILKANYGHAGRRFIEGLREHPDMIDLMRETQEIYFRQLKDNATDKQALSASFLLAADALADLILFEDGRSLTAEELAPLLVTKEQANTGKRAYEWLLGWAGSNPSHFSTTGEWLTECWGEVKGNILCVNTVILRREMTNAGFNVDSFLSWAVREGKLKRGRDEYAKATRIRFVTGVVKCFHVVMDGDDEDAANAYEIKDPEVLEAFKQMEI